MTYGHAASVYAAMGTCAADPTCPRPAVVRDDDNPTVRRCARHAAETMQYTVEALVQCGRTRTHGRHDTTAGTCPGLDPVQVRVSLNTLRQTFREATP